MEPMTPPFGPAIGSGLPETVTEPVGNFRLKSVEGEFTFPQADSQPLFYEGSGFLSGSDVCRLLLGTAQTAAREFSLVTDACPKCDPEQKERLLMEFGRLQQVLSAGIRALADSLLSTDEPISV